jgi:hypothetical protein
MNWKILLVSAILVIALIVLGSLQVIGIPLAAILSASIGVIGIAVSLIGDLNKPKISLHIAQPKLEMKQYGDYQGYKMVSKVTNKGDKIAFNLEASANFKEQIEVSQINIRRRNDHRSYSSSNQAFEKDKYSWIDDKGKTIGNIVSQLRKKDWVQLMFPTRYKLGLSAAFGSVTGRNRSHSFGSASDTLLNLEPKKTYIVEVEVKGEDNDKNTVIEQKKFKIKIQ